MIQENSIKRKDKNQRIIEACQRRKLIDPYKLLFKYKTNLINKQEFGLALESMMDLLLHETPITPTIKETLDLILNLYCKSFSNEKSLFEFLEFNTLSTNYYHLKAMCMNKLLTYFPEKAKKIIKPILTYYDKKKQIKRRANEEDLKSIRVIRYFINIIKKKNAKALLSLHIFNDNDLIEFMLSNLDLIKSYEISLSFKSLDYARGKGIELENSKQYNNTFSGDKMNFKRSFLNYEQVLNMPERKEPFLKDPYSELLQIKTKIIKKKKPGHETTYYVNYELEKQAFEKFIRAFCTYYKLKTFHLSFSIFKQKYVDDWFLIMHLNYPRETDFKIAFQLNKYTSKIIEPKGI